MFFAPLELTFSVGVPAVFAFVNFTDTLAPASRANVPVVMSTVFAAVAAAVPQVPKRFTVAPVTPSCLTVWCAVMTVPRSTTPVVPLDEPFILMPVIVPTFAVAPAAIPSSLPLSDALMAPSSEVVAKSAFSSTVVCFRSVTCPRLSTA